MRPRAQNFRHMFPKLAKKSSCVLPVTAANFDRLQRLGEAMASIDPAPEVDTIPAGYTYWGQFIDHDVTLDGQSSIDAPVKQRPKDLRNFRSGRLDLDNVYGGGPSIDPWLYDRNADTLAIGVNQDNGPADSPNPNLNFDVPRAPGSQIALIGDPRNDENLFVAQLQHAFLRFHNAVVAGLPAGAGRFKKAREMVRHHYQWAVVHDFLPTVCDPAVVAQVFQRAGPVKSPRLRAIPVEFSVAAYRFGHSLVRDRYAINRNFPNEPLSQVFAFVRPPHVPVRSNWVVDFRRFFQTGANVPMNFARPVDPNLAMGLNQLPDEVVAALKRLGGRNLRRGLVLGLPTGQCVAKRLRQPVLTIAQLKQDLSPEIAAILDEDNGELLEKTPLWFYVLQESAVRSGSKHLGPVGSFIVARTFRDMIVQDSSSYLYTPGFTPSLGTAGQMCPIVVVGAQSPPTQVVTGGPRWSKLGPHTWVQEVEMVRWMAVLLPVMGCGVKSVTVRNPAYSPGIVTSPSAAEFEVMSRDLGGRHLEKDIDCTAPAVAQEVRVEMKGSKARVTWKCAVPKVGP